MYRAGWISYNSIAIFVFGFAPGDDVQPEQDEDELDFRVPCHPKSFKHNDELWFEGISSDQCPKQIRSIIARMHFNLGHIPNKDLIRLLLLEGASAPALAAASALRCAPCLRKQKLARPHPTHVPRCGQFNDRIYILILCTDIENAFQCLCTVTREHIL